MTCDDDMLSTVRTSLCPPLEKGSSFERCMRGYDCTHYCVTFNCCCGDFSATSSSFFLVALVDVLRPSSHQWFA
jgi:hypothetical protein